MARKRSKHIPLAVLKRRQAKLERLVTKRLGSKPGKNVVPLRVLQRRLKRLDAIVARRS